MKNSIQKSDLNFKKVKHSNSFKLIKTIFVISAASACLYSCSGNYESRDLKEKAALADSVSGIISSSAAQITGADSNHSFIRTADIKFKVKDVKQATFQIEDVISKHKGYITYTNLSSTVSYQNKTQVSEDSLKESTYYHVDNSITIRVPNTQLDSVLRELAPFMDFLDHRTIKADNVKFTLLANQLAEKRFNHHKERYAEAVDKKGKKLKEIANAENDLLEKQELADDGQIGTMELLDRVNYSTVTLYIYQPETMKQVLVASEKVIPPYKPSFVKRLGESFVNGWIIFEGIILFFVQIWGIIVLGILLYFSIKKLVLYLSRPTLKKA